jgi:hypothetical protein
MSRDRIPSVSLPSRRNSKYTPRFGSNSSILSHQSTEYLDDSDQSWMSFLKSLKSSGNFARDVKSFVIYVKYNTHVGFYWDIVQVILSAVACISYVSETYNSSYSAIRIYKIIENITTQFFLLDFITNWITASRTVDFLVQPMTWVDIVTILPVYIEYAMNTSSSLGRLRFVRILRLIRILRTFKMLGGLSGIRKQIITLLLATTSLTFLAAGVINIVENEINQLSYDCKFINARTDYQPSCSKYHPVEDSCDCGKYNCVGTYDIHDGLGEPSRVRCTVLPFFQCIYYIIVTVSSVGYGDIHPTTVASKAVIIIFIATSLIVIPAQVNKLLLLLSSTSQYRKPYNPQSYDYHIVLCGYVNDAVKTGKLLRELFHPKRSNAVTSQTIHVVILCPAEPTDDMKALLISPLFDSRVTYVVGSALSYAGLQKVRLDAASAMFFLCNLEVNNDDATLENAATVLRALSATNFNANLSCFIEVLRPQDRELLKDIDVEIVLCLDEYKTVLQARNAICPGLSTLSENLCTTFGPTTKSGIEHNKDKSGTWTEEYLAGARMEIYHIPIYESMFNAVEYLWALLVEMIYIQFDCILLGLLSSGESLVVLNPTVLESKSHKIADKYYAKFNVALLIAKDQATAVKVCTALMESDYINWMFTKITVAEEHFSVRGHLLAP